MIPLGLADGYRPARGNAQPRALLNGASVPISGVSHQRVELVLGHGDRKDPVLEAVVIKNIGKACRYDATNAEVDALELANRYHADERTQYAVANLVIVPEFYSPNDPLFAQQWHLDHTSIHSGTVGADIDVLEAWKISMPLYRRMEQNAQILEYKCVPFAEDAVYGHLRKGEDRTKPTMKNLH